MRFWRVAQLNAAPYRTQEVGGSNPPSSISASPRLRGLLETVPTVVWPSGGCRFRRPRRWLGFCPTRGFGPPAPPTRFRHRPGATVTQGPTPIDRRL